MPNLLVIAISLYAEGRRASASIEVFYLYALIRAICGVYFIIGFSGYSPQTPESIPMAPPETRRLKVHVPK